MSNKNQKCRLGQRRKLILKSINDPIKKTSNRDEGAHYRQLAERFFQARKVTLDHSQRGFWLVLSPDKFGVFENVFVFTHIWKQSDLTARSV